jgi:hypothetical protein
MGAARRNVAYRTKKIALVLALKHRLKYRFITAAKQPKPKEGTAMKPQALMQSGLLRSITGFRPQQAPVARKVLSSNDAVKDTLASVPQSVFMSELRKAGDEHLCSVPELIEIHRQSQISEKVADMYVILRELDLEWPALQKMTSADMTAWMQLLVNRARVLRDEIDEISHAGRN